MSKAQVHRRNTRSIQVTATAVLAMALKDTMMPVWITVAEYASFVNISKTSARASLKLAVKQGFMIERQTGLKAFFYEPASHQLRKLAILARDNDELQQKIQVVANLDEIPF